jgi:hypothetical protein
VNLFKSREERRMERTMQLKRVISNIQRQIQKTDGHRRKYVDMAKRAKRNGQTKDFESLKRALRGTMNQKIMLERQLLSLEFAMQLKDQAEGQHDFAQAMNSLSKSIAEVFGATNMAQTQINFEKAMAQASDMESRMETFLESTADTMFSNEPSGDEPVVNDAEIDRMLAEEAAEEERSDSGGLDNEIASIQREIDRLKR